MNCFKMGTLIALREKSSQIRNGLMLIMFFFMTHLMAQETVNGTVVDPDGVPLPGVNVVIKGTNSGTSTDFDGNFTIDVSSSDVLEFSFVGFKNQDVQVGDSTSFNISMEEEASFLDEIIVTGYGTQTRREVTASIVKVDAADIERIAVASSIDAIKGQVAGVDIQSAGGRPGQSPVVRIRGRRSLSASNDPLYVVDGIPVTSSVAGGAIADIAPQDIQSMEILKDAAATAIYGSRGANGVILITTKRGKTGEKTRVSYSGYYGTSEVTNIPQMMNSEQWLNMSREAWRRDANNNFTYAGTTTNDLNVLINGGDAPLIANYNAGVEYDWLDMVLQKGSQTSHNVSVMGGSEKNTI